MPVRKKTSTTRLPQPLREELDSSIGNYHPKMKSLTQASRKEVRKQERVVRKQNRADFFSVRHKRPAEEDHEESPYQKKAKQHRPKTSTSSGALPATTKASRKDVVPVKPPPILRHSKNVKEPRNGLAEGSYTTQTPTVKTRREEEEDSYIAYLESKLGYTKGNKKAMENDGLDDLLDLTSSLAKRTQQNYDIEASNTSGPEDDGSIEDEIFEEWRGIDEEAGSIDDGQKMEDLDNGLSESEDAHITTPNTQQEATGTRYIPPHLRHAQRENEGVIKLTRQLKGLLNRLSEPSMAGILDSIEEVYRNHSRNDVTSTLTKLIIDEIASHSSLLDSYVVMYAAFVTSLHRIIGTEFAAYFVQNVVSLYEQRYADIPASGPETAPGSEPKAGEMGKECANLIVLLAELYNFQVISSVLVFDITRWLLAGDLTEFGVELLLKIIRNSGQQLRQDDPSALKDIIEIVQDKVDKSGELSPRTRFMIETLINLKNNKLKRNTTQNQGGEAVERMKKFIAGLAKKKHFLAHEPLRVSLDDLHSAEIKGKWWLVGAAWSGDPLTDRQETTESQQTIDEIHNNSLLKLARKQGMNTDIRRSIFVVLMTSDDYVDACERLSQLSLNEIQQREIVRVILHCCGNEKSYNPYYTLVGQHLCRSSHSYKITLQFCLWDFFRDLGETSVGGTYVTKTHQDDEDDSFELKKISRTRVRNVAKAYGWWIAKDCVTLTILKPVDFTNLKSQSQEFLRELLVQIFVSSQVVTPMLSSDWKHLPSAWNLEAVEQVFIKATRIQRLAMGLVYFMSEAFRDLSEDEEGITKLIKWANNVGKDTLRTGVDVAPNF